MLRKITLTFMLALVALSTAAAYDVNKDLKNIGPPAYDIAVLLAGQETVTDHYDGYTLGGKTGWFNSYTCMNVSGNTLLHWQAFEDNGNDIIDFNQIIHVGWSTLDGNCVILDMWWTDINGDRIPGSIIYNTVPAAEFIWSMEQITPIWIDPFPVPIDLIDIQYAVLPNAVPLDQLNEENTMLASLFAPLPGGGLVTLQPGVPFGLPVPQAVSNHDFVVFRYGMTGVGGTAESLDFVQLTPVSLTTDVTELSVSGGQANFFLDATAENAGRIYLLLGSMSGSMPGTPLPGGGEILPLNLDNFSNLVLRRLNDAIFSNFFGALDGAGQAWAQLNAPPLSPTKIGKVMTYAYCLEGTPDWNFTSNPVDIVIVP